MPNATNEMVIARPPAEVYAFLAERENDTRWRPGVLDMKLVSGSGVGARYAQGVKGPRGRRIPADIEITELEPERRVAFQTVAGPVRPSGRYELSPADGGTRVRFDLDAKLSGLKRLMAPMVQKTMNSEVAQLDSLKRTLEGSP